MVKLFAVVLVTIISAGTVTYTVLQLRNVEHLLREHVQFQAELLDLSQRLTALESRLSQRLDVVEQAVTTKVETRKIGR